MSPVLLLSQKFIHMVITLIINWIRLVIIGTDSGMMISQAQCGP